MLDSGTVRFLLFMLGVLRRKKRSIAQLAVQVAATSRAQDSHIKDHATRYHPPHVVETYCAEIAAGTVKMADGNEEETAETDVGYDSNDPME
jgi:hypothetical protein